MERFLKRCRILRERAVATTRADSIQLNLRGIIVLAVLLDGGGDDCTDKRQRHQPKSITGRCHVAGIPCADYRRKLSKDAVVQLGLLLKLRHGEALGAVQLAYGHAVAAWEHLLTKGEDPKVVRDRELAEKFPGEGKADGDSEAAKAPAAGRGRRSQARKKLAGAGATESAAGT